MKTFVHATYTKLLTEDIGFQLEDLHKTMVDSVLRRERVNMVQSIWSSQYGPVNWSGQYGPVNWSSQLVQSTGSVNWSDMMMMIH